MKSKEITTTIGVDPVTAREFKTLAKQRNIPVRAVPRLLLEGWRTLNPDQEFRAWSNYGNLHRRPSKTANA